MAGGGSTGQWAAAGGGSMALIFYLPQSVGKMKNTFFCWVKLALFAKKNAGNQVTQRLLRKKMRDSKIKELLTVLFFFSPFLFCLFPPKIAVSNGGLRMSIGGPGGKKNAKNKNCLIVPNNGLLGKK